MAGRGGVYNDTSKNIIVWDGVIPPECRSNPSILRLEWEETKEPLHADIDVNKTNGVGPGMSFANRVGEFLYEETVKRAKAAVASGGGSYQAVLWYQGARPYLDVVRKAQLETDLENVNCVDAMGLPLEPDGLHLTTSSQVRLGQMMVDAFLAIRPIPSSAKLFSGLSVLVLFPLFLL
ncbi:hypothetical protein F2Q69_00015466 [Brassica cretica]|uniref:Sialate O-acetylesterase domain-containing protein n=1 Tax=Brassica cretica TaxID=69181 RepID=A0A8S9QQX5_BRACR|nr:hypothetical protein F2Q69_00015466 [Brassica cretica]